MRVLSLTLCGIAAYILSLHAEIAPEIGTVAGVQSAVAFEQIPAELSRCDDTALKKLASLLGVLRSESAGKRISAPAADQLIAALEALKSPLPGGETVLLAGVLMPGNNATVTRAIADFESSVEAAQIRRSILLNQAVPEIKRRAADAARNSWSAADIDRLLSVMESVQSVMRSPSVSAIDRWQTSTFWCISRFLKHLKPLLALKESDDRLAITRTLSDFDRSAQLVPDLLSAGEIDVIRRPAEGLRQTADALYQITEKNERKAADRAVDQAQKAVHSAFTDERPEKEISNAINDLELAWQQRRSKFWPLEYNEDGAVYQQMRLFRQIAEIARDRRAQSPDRMNLDVIAVGGLREHISAPNRSAWDRLLSKWTDEWLDALKKAEDDNRHKYFAALKLVKTPRDLKKLLADAVTAERAGTKVFPAGLAASLASLNGDWERSRENFSGRVVGAGALITSEARITSALLFEAESMNSDVELGMALHGLRERLARDLISVSCHLPEIKLPPLDAETLRTALETVADRHASSGQWREFSQITEILSAYFRGQPTRRMDAGQAAGNYLAGLNCETMGDWSRAAHAYKTVLRLAARPTPAKEAAERLRNLVQKHPEVKKSLLSDPTPGVTQGS